MTTWVCDSCGVETRIVVRHGDKDKCTPCLCREIDRLKRQRHELKRQIACRDRGIRKMHHEWGEWLKTPDQFVSPDLLNAMSDLCDLAGLPDFDDDEPVHDEPPGCRSCPPDSTKPASKEGNDA